jgi:hypothetical protein
MSNSELHNTIVKRVLETKAIDFGAVGKIIGEVGPSLAAAADDDGYTICGTNRNIVFLCRWYRSLAPVEGLAELAAAARED